ncbi:unnamed protein product [Cylicocyclus nassatus]|uniref:Uncharacterized protein n=1 Tax=Cylicocyclus nassatus TaxID=53992 RepID=A0AA36HG24_CYLNA|nr:unnamed protein product [Cylicocyclus nassatus]
MRALPCFSLLIVLFDLSLAQYQQPTNQQSRVNNRASQFLEKVICTGCQLPNGRYSYLQQGSYGQQGVQQPNAPPPSTLQNQQFSQQRVQQTYSQQAGGYQQQYNGNAMGLYNQQQQTLRTGSAIVLNTPQRLDTFSASTVNGAQVQIRLTSYQNPTMALTNTTTCNCPISYCDYLPQNQQNACSFSFVTVISSAYQSVQYIQSDFNPFFGTISTGNWTNPHTFQMIAKPVAIDVFVQHLGVSIDRATGNLLYFGRLQLVDCFVVDLSRFKSSTGGEQSLTLTGTELGTQLQLVLNVQCINGMMGEMCDMTCQTGSAINNYVVCTNNRTGDYLNCTYNSYNAQITNCVLCVPSGSSFNGTCVMPVQEIYTGVSSAFRVWTIVLGCLLGVAVLLILCLIISYIIKVRNENPSESANVYDSMQPPRPKNVRVKNRERYEEPSTYKSTTSYTNGRASRPLIQEDEWTTVTRKPITTEREESYTRNGITTTTTKVSRQEHQV